MTRPHWTTSEADYELPNALDGLQEPICRSLDSDGWAHSISSDHQGSDVLVRSPSSYSEPASWFSKNSSMDSQADYPTENWAQFDNGNALKPRSERFRSLDDWVSPTSSAVQPDHKLRCTYLDCTAPPFYTLCDFKAHLKGHSVDVLRRWEEGQPCRCPWSGNCKSKAIFKSRRNLQTHLENVHITPLVCTVSGCSYRKPFRSNYDLKRHMLTAHSSENSSQLLLCPYPSCNRDPKHFVRKDKWLIHIATCHDGTECPINHCQAGKIHGILNHNDLMTHIRNDHGKFECGIGSCSLTAASRFSEAELLTHLELHHQLPHREIHKARSAVKISSDKTIKRIDPSSPGRDCRYCKETVLKQKSDAVLNLVRAEVSVDEFRTHTLSFERLLNAGE